MDESSDSELTPVPDDSLLDSMSLDNDSDSSSTEPPIEVPLKEKLKNGQMTIDAFTKPRPVVTIKLSKKSIDAASRSDSTSVGDDPAKSVKDSAKKKNDNQKYSKEQKITIDKKISNGKRKHNNDEVNDKNLKKKKKVDSKKSTSTSISNNQSSLDSQSKAKMTTSSKKSVITKKRKEDSKDKGNEKSEIKKRSPAKLKTKKPLNGQALNGQASVVPCEPEDLPWDDKNLYQDSNVVPQPEGIEHSSKIAMLVMFQARFHSLFRGVPSLGPQDIETGLMSPEIPYSVLQFMVRLMSLALNRKKPIDPERYGGALEEIRDKLSSLGPTPTWPLYVNLKSKTAITDLTWEDRLEFFHTLVLWALTHSEAVRAILNDVNQKGSIHDGGDEDQQYAYSEDDIQMKKIMMFKTSLEKDQLGKPVTCLGKDSTGVQYYFIKGRGTSPFRIYKQTNPRLRTVNWISVASSVDQVKDLINKISNDSNNNLSSSSTVEKLKEYLENMIVYLDYLEEERAKIDKKREKKRALQQAADLIRSGAGVYVGRTRGKKVNYNIDSYNNGIDLESSDEDEYDYDEDQQKSSFNGGLNAPTRRSARIREMNSYEEYSDDDDDQEEEGNYLGNGKDVDYKIKEDEGNENEENMDEEIEDEKMEDQGNELEDDTGELSKMIVLKYSSLSDIKENAETNSIEKRIETESTTVPRNQVTSTIENTNATQEIVTGNTRIPNIENGIEIDSSPTISSSITAYTRIPSKTVEPPHSNSTTHQTITNGDTSSIDSEAPQKATSEKLQTGDYYTNETVVSDQTNYMDQLT